MEGKSNSTHGLAHPVGPRWTKIGGAKMTQPKELPRSVTKQSERTQKRDQKEGETHSFAFGSRHIHHTHKIISPSTSCSIPNHARTIRHASPSRRPIPPWPSQCPHHEGENAGETALERPEGCAVHWTVLWCWSERETSGEPVQRWSTYPPHPSPPPEYPRCSEPTAAGPANRTSNNHRCLPAIPEAGTEGAGT